MTDNSLKNKKGVHPLNIFFLWATAFISGWLVGQYNSFLYMKNYGYEITKGCTDAKETIFNKQIFDFTEALVTLLVFIGIWIAAILFSRRVSDNGF